MIWAANAPGVCTVHPQLANLNYPTPQLFEHKISQATPTLQKPRGSWQLQTLTKWRFPIVKSKAECQKCIDYQREAGYLQAYGYR